MEAAYRKELVYGEDHPDRADPATTAELFDNVRRNYFRLYGHYIYFNVVRYTYLQADNIFSFIILGPSLVAHKITFGTLNQNLQRLRACQRLAAASDQFLVDDRRAAVGPQAPARLRGDAGGRAAAAIDQRYLEKQELATDRD